MWHLGVLRRNVLHCLTQNNMSFVPKLYQIRKPVGKSSVNDTNLYAHLDKLKNKLFNENPYTLVELTYEVMGISKDNTPDRIKRSNLRPKFVSDLGAKFPINVFVYSRQVTLGNWYFFMKDGTQPR